MSDLLVVLPVITPTYADRCIDSIRAPDNAFAVGAEAVARRESLAGVVDDEDVVEVHLDPDGHNLGVARAWNVGAREVLDRGLDYLVVMSVAMQFGPILHTTWRRQMETFWGSTVIEADGHSWHLIAFHRRVFEEVGLFDGNFYPAYEEAIDFGYRMRMVGMEGNTPEHPWQRVWVNALSQGSALHNEVVSCPNDPLRAYYASKWGGMKGDESYVLPFGDRPLDYWEDTPIPTLAVRYGLREWW